MKEKTLKGSRNYDAMHEDRTEKSRRTFSLKGSAEKDSNDLEIVS